jgi:hypothetical protein
MPQAPDRGPLFANGPSCAHCQNAHGFEIGDYPWEWPWPSPGGPDLIPRSVGVLFSIPRCTHRWIVTVATDSEGCSVFYTRDLDSDDDLLTGDKVASPLDPSPHA